MADVEAKEGGSKGKSKAGAKKQSTRVDMTAMVDMAFLLITFFMLTTTMSKPQTMEITMPDKQKGKQDVMKVKESRSVTLVLGEENKVYYYQGVTDQAPEVHTTNFGAEGIRKVLLEKKREIGKVENPQTKKLEDGIIVIIKAQDTSKYRNMVDILDEMNITNINTYAIVDITDDDLALIEAADQAAAAGGAAAGG